MSQYTSPQSASGLPTDGHSQPRSPQEESVKILLSPPDSLECDVLDLSVKIHQCDSWDQLPELCARAICGLMGAVDARWVEISADGNKTLWACSSSEEQAAYMREHITSMEARAIELGAFYRKIAMLMMEQSDEIIRLKTSLSPEGLKTNPYVNDFLKPMNVVDIISLQLFNSAGGSVIICLGMPDGEIRSVQFDHLKFIRAHIRAACAKLSRLASFTNLTDALKQRWQEEKHVGISVLSKDGETLWESDHVSNKMLQDLGGELGDDGKNLMPNEMAIWAKSILGENTRICAQTGEHTLFFKTEQGLGVNASLLLERAGSGALLILKRDKASGDYGGIFTRRELDVIHCIAEGMTSQEVSENLHISKRTVDKHLENIYTKLDVSNRVSAIKRLEVL